MSHKIFPNLNSTGGVDPRLLTRGVILGADARPENKSGALKSFVKETDVAARDEIVKQAIELNEQYKGIANVARAIRKNEKKARSNKKLQEHAQVEALEHGPQIRKHFSLHDLKEISPINDRQREMFHSWAAGQHILASGSAGTGKTFLAIFLALRELLDEETPFERIILVRSTVSVREMGFLPGDLEEKQAAYEMPYVSIFDELFPFKHSYENLKKNGMVQFMSTSFLRGTTFNNAIIIADEVQNFNFQEISTLSTRVGRNSRIIYCGDTIQTDLLYKKSDESGMKDFQTMASTYMKSIDVVRFNRDDIVRSGFVKEFIIACEKAFSD